MKYLSFTVVPEAGLIFKIEKISKHVSNLNLKKNILINSTSKFQFSYNVNSNSYIGEIFEGQYISERNDKSDLKKQDFIISSREFITSNNEKIGKNSNNSNLLNSNRDEKNAGEIITSQDIIESKPKSYADNIHLLRLVDNVICEIEEMKTEEKEELEQLENRENDSIFNKSDEKEDYNDDNGFEVKSTFKSRKQFFDVINQQIVPKVIKNLKWGGNILVVCLIIIAFTSHFISVLEFQEITDTLSLKISQDREISELIYIVQNIQYLILLNKGLFGNRTTLLENQYKSNIENSLVLIENIQNTLQLSTSTLSEKQLEVLTTDNVKIYFNTSSFQLFDLNQASQQIISKSFNVINLQLSDFSLTEPNIFFVMFNMFNDYYINMMRMSDYYVNDVNYMINEKETIFLILLIMSVLLNSVSIIILTPLILKVSHSKDKVLTLFLDIPPKVLKKLCLKCENFLTNLQVGDEDDVASERSEPMTNEDDNDVNEGIEAVPGKAIKKRKRKKSKNSTRGQKKFIFTLIFGVLVFQIYFAMNYLFSENLINGLVPLIKEANDTSKAEPIYAFYHASLGFFHILYFFFIYYIGKH